MKNLITLLTTLILLSCSKDKQDNKLVLNENDNMIFTSYSPEAPAGFKPTFYKLTNSQVLEDETSGFVLINDNENQGNFIELGSEKYNLAKDLIGFIPNKLLSVDQRIGNPGGLDGGVLYFQLTKNGVKKVWEMDSDSKAVPEEYSIFVQKVNEKIAILR